MRQWVKKLAEQFDVEWGWSGDKAEAPSPTVSEERATLLYVIDTYNKHLLELDRHPVRRVRETLDEFTKSLVTTGGQDLEKLLFRFRQFFASYRIDEFTYVQKTFEDFKNIIWDFADQLSEEVSAEESSDKEVQRNLAHLREAVDSNSIEDLRKVSRQFIDFYVESHTRSDERRARRVKSIQQSLDTVKTKLTQANLSMRLDHLTSAFNRKSFDEQVKAYTKLYGISHNPVTLVMLDIDYFKKINDCYGHGIGDFVLKECVRLLRECFNRDEDFVARVGGEEFAILLPDQDINLVKQRAEGALAKIRKEVFVQGEIKINFTVSMGLAQFQPGETPDQWMKRADDALYHSKHSGRDRLTLAPAQGQIKAA